MQICRIARPHRPLAITRAPRCVMTQAANAAAILLRTHRFNEEERAFATRLAAQAGMPVHIVADETRGEVETTPFLKISLQRSLLEKMRLHCPRDVAWRCGDYAFYLARRNMPDISHFWLVEPDVRFGFSDYGQLFDGFQTVSADFIAPFMKPAEREHFWQPTMRWMTPDVFRCFFAFCRMSAKAADHCLEQRQRLRWHPAARIMWPNDETFVSTILVKAGFVAKDINDFGRQLVTEESFGFLNLQRGEALEPSPSRWIDPPPRFFTAQSSRASGGRSEARDCKG